MRAGRIVGLTLGFCAACSPEPAPPAGTDTYPAREECNQQPDGVICTDRGEAVTCRGSQVVDSVDCSSLGQVCSAPEGCLACRPGERSCEGNAVTECRADGSGYDMIEACDDALSCSPNGCRDLCAQARSERSYIGCEYFPVFASNHVLDPLFKPAVVIANPNLVAARVKIERAGQPVAEAEVPPSGVETVMLRHVAPLRTPHGSALVRGGAYHLVSSVPVTVHQFNPLLYRVNKACEPREQAPCYSYSYSNDASLLLPAHVLARGEGEGTAYLAVTRASLLNRMQEPQPDGSTKTTWPSSPGFVAIVGASASPVRVRIKSSARTFGTGEGPIPKVSDQDDPAPIEEVPALIPGARLDSEILGPGDVLQLLSASPETCPGALVPTRRQGESACPLGAEFDLTGTEIEADGPIAVIAGHSCAYVPFDRIACDHLEESMFPLETWSTEVVVSRPRVGEVLPQMVRVISALDDNVVRFEPAESPPVTLARGQSFELLSTEHLLVRADKPISVAQFLIGQNGEDRAGDPSLTIAIPSAQYRQRYAFLSPQTYSLNYVSLIARTGDRIVLDGDEVTDFMPVGDGGFEVATVKLLKSGAHEVHSLGGLGVGVQIYGYGDYTSYMLPGGLDLKVIGMVW
jgi:hypothetical protein